MKKKIEYLERNCLNCEQNGKCKKQDKTTIVCSEWEEVIFLKVDKKKNAKISQKKL
jgi:hypothetical protein